MIYGDKRPEIFKTLFSLLTSKMPEDKMLGKTLLFSMADEITPGQFRVLYSRCPRGFDDANDLQQALYDKRRQKELSNKGKNIGENNSL